MSLNLKLFKFNALCQCLRFQFCKLVTPVFLFSVFCTKVPKKGFNFACFIRQDKTKQRFVFFGAANLKLKPINLLACWVMSWFFVSGSVGLQFDLFFRARLKQQWWEGGCSSFFFELAKVGIHAMV